MSLKLILYIKNYIILFSLHSLFHILSAITIIILLIIIYRTCKVKQVLNEKMKKQQALTKESEVLKMHKTELEAQSEELKAISQALKVEQDQTMASIRYAKTIQNAVLPVLEKINKNFNSAIIFRPKDLVSGDFYWLTKQTNKQGTEFYFFAVVDCTGHGVPGAFMSMIGSGLLNEIVKVRRIYETNAILEHLDRNVFLALKQSQSHNNDGMELILCRIELENDSFKIQYSGAKRSFFYYDSSTDKVEIKKTTRRSIGGLIAQKSNKPFVKEYLQLPQGSNLYLFSDGIIDQCNPERHKYGYERLLNLIDSMRKKPINEQIKAIDDDLDDFQDYAEQRDDITLLGIHLN